MQMHGATALELKMFKALGRTERELPPSELATEIAVAISDGVSELQSLRQRAELAEEKLARVDQAADALIAELRKEVQP